MTVEKMRAKPRLPRAKKEVFGAHMLAGDKVFISGLTSAVLLAQQIYEANEEKRGLQKEGEVADHIR